jgi:hypothetical protein
MVGDKFTPAVHFDRDFSTGDNDDNVFAVKQNNTMYTMVTMDGEEFKGKSFLYVDDPFNPVLGAMKSIAFGVLSALSLAYTIVA